MLNGVQLSSAGKPGRGLLGAVWKAPRLGHGNRAKSRVKTPLQAVRSVRDEGSWGRPGTACAAPPVRSPNRTFGKPNGGAVNSAF